MDFNEALSKIEEGQSLRTSRRAKTSSEEESDPRELIQEVAARAEESSIPVSCHILAIRVVVCDRCGHEEETTEGLFDLRIRRTKPETRHLSRRSAAPIPGMPVNWEHWPVHVPACLRCLPEDLKGEADTRGGRPEWDDLLPPSHPLDSAEED